LKNLEIFYNGWASRQTTQSGSYPTDITVNPLTVHGKYIKIINCIVHDLYDGLVISLVNTAAEMHGNLFFHNGWLGPDRGHGHAMYLHNVDYLMTVKNNICFDNFGLGIHAYHPNASNLKNFLFEGNTCFRNGSLASAISANLLLGGDSGQADTATFQSNMSYGAGVGNTKGLQFYGGGAINMTLTDNYVPDGKMGTYTAVSETGNYWGPDIGNQVFLRANDYDSSRANLTIYNQAASNSISVDVSSIFSPGDSIFCRHTKFNSCRGWDNNHRYASSKPDGSNTNSVDSTGDHIPSIWMLCP